jgi:hypothetical protein
MGTNTEGLGLPGSQQYLADINRMVEPNWKVVSIELGDALTAANARIAELEVEREDLRLLILGGEDAPGLAASLSFEQVQRAHQENVANARDRAEFAEARCAEIITRAVQFSGMAYNSGFSMGIAGSRVVATTDGIQDGADFAREYVANQLHALATDGEKT